MVISCSAGTRNRYFNNEFFYWNTIFVSWLTPDKSWSGFDQLALLDVLLNTSLILTQEINSEANQYTLACTLAETNTFEGFCFGEGMFNSGRSGPEKEVLPVHYRGAHPILLGMKSSSIPYSQFENLPYINYSITLDGCLKFGNIWSTV